jgi:uncharacterized protein (TIGR03435 family)
MAVERISMPKLAESLSRVVGSPVEDETHTEGLFSFTLEWSPDSPHSAPAADGTPLEPLGPSLFTVLQQQLGVKLEPAKVPVDVLVIERAEKPSEN